MAEDQMAALRQIKVKPAPSGSTGEMTDADIADARARELAEATQ